MDMFYEGWVKNCMDFKVKGVRPRGTTQRPFYGPLSGLPG